MVESSYSLMEGRQTLEVGFDFDAAFQGAMSDVYSDEERALEEKVAAMEVILIEAKSEVYQDFVDFRELLSQFEFFCNHDHEFDRLAHENETINDMLETDHGHDHSSTSEKRSSKLTKKAKSVWSQLFSYVQTN